MPRGSPSPKPSAAESRPIEPIAAHGQNIGPDWKLGLFLRFPRAEEVPQQRDQGVARGPGGPPYVTEL